VSFVPCIVFFSGTVDIPSFFNSFEYICYQFPSGFALRSSCTLELAVSHLNGFDTVEKNLLKNAYA
jgi:hypothetical protein